MENEHQLVTEKVEKGIYFNDALSWYNGKYIFIQTQFSQMLVVAFIALTAFILTFLGFLSLLPVNEKQLFVIYDSITPDRYLKVKALMKPGENPDYVYSKYLVGEYVKSREEYIVESSERDFNFVYNMSDQNVLENYLEFVSPDNPLSPFVVYANRGSRNIEVTNVTFYDDKGKVTHHPIEVGRAEVDFVAQENFGAQAQKVANYTANVEFKYSKITIDQKTAQLTHKAEMVITNYTTKLSSGSNK